VLSFQDVEFSYNNQPVFTNLNLDMNQGEFVFLIGRSGVGKSTLLQMIYMNLRPDSGNVRVGEYDSGSIKPRQIPLLRRKLGVIFQDFKLLENRNVFENLVYVLNVTNAPRREAKRKINNVLADVGLSHKRLNMPSELSGGEQQRVAIARAVLNDPILVLADEPTGNLDPETSNDILEILKKINKSGTAILVATHNYELVKKAKEKIVKIEDGRAFKAVIKQSNESSSS
jgi:cell division transport system ATP-binding protein